MFVVDRESRADGDEFWYMEERDNKATTTIAWVDNERKADLSVFFVDRESRAKWNKPHNLQNQM